MKTGAEKLLLWAFVIVLLPMTIAGGYLSWRAFDEGTLYAEASALPATGERESGRFYQHQGIVAAADGAGLASVEGFPEVDQALTYRITIERRSSAEADWVLDENATILKGRSERFAIGGVPVAFGPHASLATPISTIYREDGPNRRFKIEQQRAVNEAGAPRELIAFGHYNHGTIGEGPYERLLIVAPEQKTETLALIAATGRRKGVYLSVITGIVLILLGATARAALRSARPR